MARDQDSSVANDSEFVRSAVHDPNSLISRTEKVELIATEFFQQSCDCLGYLEQHTKSCKSYLVGKYIYFQLKNDHFYA